MLVAADEWFEYWRVNTLSLSVFSSHFFPMNGKQESKSWKWGGTLGNTLEQRLANEQLTDNDLIRSIFEKNVWIIVLEGEQFIVPSGSHSVQLETEAAWFSVS